MFQDNTYHLQDDDNKKQMGGGRGQREEAKAHKEKD